jgi:tripartite-type tricarboxylate transporter receptor subunit TctC
MRPVLVIEAKVTPERGLRRRDAVVNMQISSKRGSHIVVVPPFVASGSHIPVLREHRRKKNMIRMIVFLLGLVFSIEHVGVLAQSYPVKPVRFVVPGPPVGLTDTLARMLAQKLDEAWGQRFVVENRAGSNGTIGTEFVARAPPDGYTIMMGHTGTHAINISLRKFLPYDPVKDFVAISLIAVAPNILVVHPSLPARSVKELIALAKARPGQLTYASSGVGGTQHLAGALFEKMAEVKMVHVPYKGSAPGLVDVIAGNVSLMFPNIPTALPHVKSGRLRALGVTSLQRSSAAPSIPTIAEAGLPGYEATVWFGVFAPAGLSPELVTRLNGEIVKIIKRPDIRESVTGLGGELVGDRPEEFAVFLKAQINKWAVVIKESGAQEQ